MNIKYINSNGQTVNLNQYPYKMLISDILDSEPDVIENNGRIIGFDNDIITQREVNIDIHRTKTTSARVSLNNLTDIFAFDVATVIPGRLYINDWYIPCYFYGRETDRWQTDNIISCEYKLVTDHPFWISEQHIAISPISGTEEVDENAKGYPYGYPYSYTNVKKNTNIKIDHYTDSDFRMIAYGPTTSVNISINGHPYHVDYPIEVGEYMVIDSRSYLPPDERIYVVRNNGERINVFNNRDPEYSVFQKIPCGNVTIYYSRNYGIDLTIFLERSEPKWKK